MITRLLPVVFILAAIGLFAGYIHPTYTGDITTLTAEIDNYKLALESAKRFKQKEVQLAGEKDQLSTEQLQRLETFLPDSVDNVQLILDLNSLASRSGVQLSDFDVSQAEKESNSFGAVELAPQTPYDSLDLSVSAVGSYPAFRSFLAGVENSLRPLDVVEIIVKDSETGVYTYEVTFRLYWLR
ncbi:type II secretion system protein M [Patescibacteria group bacterium]|nr:type II secretion system protein M [Patescibacteria group bacterium]MBU2158581.1 type II secretion system protein M [Patescibacteria group bacterium]MBU2220792.1 type II secretion system protein M [Patescibacteria group bacterium]